MIKYVISFILGGVVGGASTYFVLKKKIRIEEQQRADEQIADMERYYNQKINQHEHDEEIKAPEEYMNFNEVETPAEQNNVKEAVLDREVHKSDTVDYTEFYHVEDSYGEEATAEINSGKGPVVVDDSEFGMRPGSRTQDFYYYLDGTISFNEMEDVDDDEILDLDEVKSMLGDTIVDSHFDENDVETLTVWNSRRNTYYRITKVFSNYEGT